MRGATLSDGPPSTIIDGHGLDPGVALAVGSPDGAKLDDEASVKLAS